MTNFLCEIIAWIIVLYCITLGMALLFLALSVIVAPIYLIYKHLNEKWLLLISTLGFLLLAMSLRRDMAIIALLLVLILFALAKIYLVKRSGEAQRDNSDHGNPQN